MKHLYKLRRNAIFFACLLSAVVVVACFYIFRSDDEATIENRTLTELGFPKTEGIRAIAKWTKIGETNIPFLHSELDGKETWVVTVTGVQLKFEEGTNPFVGSFEVIRHPRTGQIAVITSSWPAGEKNTAPLPSAKSAEWQLLRLREKYSEFPPGKPKITFYEALRIADKGFASPLTAKQIIAYYVHNSYYHTESRKDPVWILMVQGIPPFHPPVYPGGTPPPDGAVNHLRTAINANTGEGFGANNCPQPE